jgi:hypothetical protein
MALDEAARSQPSTRGSDGLFVAGLLLASLLALLIDLAGDFAEPVRQGSCRVAHAVGLLQELL